MSNPDVWGKWKIRVQLVEGSNDPLREFETPIPKHVTGVYSDSEWLRAVAWYEKLEAVMKR